MNIYGASSAWLQVLRSTLTPSRNVIHVILCHCDFYSDLLRGLMVGYSVHQAHTLGFHRVQVNWIWKFIAFESLLIHFTSILNTYTHGRSRWTLGNIKPWAQSTRFQCIQHKKKVYFYKLYLITGCVGGVQRDVRHVEPYQGCLVKIWVTEINERNIYLHACVGCIHVYTYCAGNVWNRPFVCDFFIVAAPR